MKRKLLCLVLSAVFVFSGIVMSACSTTAGTDTTGGEDGEKKKNDSTLVRSPMTLTLWVPTDENTTAESISQVEAALNKITQAKYSTAIELHAVAYDKYEDQLNARMKSIKEILDQTEAEKKARKEAERAARKRGETLAPETTAETEDPNASSGATVNEYGMTFPSVTSTQLDIFLIKGYDNFKKYSEDLLLSSITDELNGNSKLIKSYVYPSLTWRRLSTATMPYPTTIRSESIHIFLLIKSFATVTTTTSIQWILCSTARTSSLTSQRTQT